MSDSPETIKEFLVSIGWQSNRAQQQQFTEALGGATLKAGLLKDAIETMANVIGQRVIETAKNFESLHFESERVKASAENIRAFEYAMSRLGGSVQDAHALIVNFADLMRKNPGLNGRGGRKGSYKPSACAHARRMASSEIK